MRPMTRFGWLVAFGWVAALWAFDTRGDETTVALSGELHVRSELTDGDFSADTEPSRATLLRSRMNVKASPSEDVAVAFTLQDAREYGSEPSTTANLRNLDLYAGHLTISRFLSDNLTLQLGRMPLSYGDERLVGVSVWSNMGRAFDGTRAQYRVSDAASIDLWGTKVRAESDERTREDRGYYFGGTYGSYKTDELKLNVYALSERDNGDANMSRWTLGTEDDLNFGAFMVRTEAAMQFGDR
ncbi:MAG: alginate export family protein, partial [Candidatus Poribacteria bacterium]|nr:alginate export family protein [Candidatus Poribacteria bacterium]